MHDLSSGDRIITQTEAMARSDRVRDIDERVGSSAMTDIFLSMLM